MATGGAADAGGAPAAGGMTSTGGISTRMKNTGGAFSTGGSAYSDGGMSTGVSGGPGGISGSGGAVANTGALPDSGISGTSETGGQSVLISQLPADAVLVCTYTQSGAEHVITAYRDVARTNYYLVSNLSKSILAHPIGTPDSRILVDRVANYEYLYVDILSGGMLEFVDATNSFDEVCRDQGPSSGFSSTCNEDGVQITLLFKDITLYLLFNRADGTVYHADIADFWMKGSYALDFYTASSGTTIDFQSDRTPIGTKITTISMNPDSTVTISFTDMDNRLVTIRLDSYRVILDIHTTQL